MAYTVRAARSEHLEWGVNRIGCVPTADMRAIECVDGAGQILGMVLYTNWSSSSVQMHVALDSKAAARRLLKAAFSYPFEECGRQVVVALVAENNKRALTLDRHLGFKEMGRIKDGWAPGVDFILLGMRKDECRWLRRARKVA